MDFPFHQFLLDQLFIVGYHEYGLQTLAKVNRFIWVWCLVLRLVTTPKAFSELNDAYISAEITAAEW